jgi:hypothetical protein
VLRRANGGDGPCPREDKGKRVKVPLPGQSESAGGVGKATVVLQQHQAARCAESSEEQLMKDAKSILTPEQYAKFNAECK